MRTNSQPDQIALFGFDQNRDLPEREGRDGLYHGYDNIISIENLLISWQEFLLGKRKKKDVAEFSADLMDNILELRQDLVEKTYKHGDYEAFVINDPKTRIIHKPLVRDRLLHHAIHRILYPYFEKKFIYDSYSCRVDKGTHRAIDRLRHFGRKVSRNDTRTAWVLKCDVRKFFASIDHGVLKNILGKYIEDSKILRLLSQVIDSFQIENRVAVGLPLGNLTSQLLINVYMNEFDQFAKHVLRIKYYIRYADDFVILEADKNKLVSLLPKIGEFLSKKLKLTLHPNKVTIKTLDSGVDFLGWVSFPNHRVLRTNTKRRMIKRWHQNQTEETFNSYLGLMKHGNTEKLQERLTKDYLLSPKNQKKTPHELKLVRGQETK